MPMPPEFFRAAIIMEVKMSALDMIRTQVKNLYETSPAVHVNVTFNTPKVSLHNEPVVIKNIYPHIFRVEDRKHKSYTLTYNDVLTKNVEILEMGSQYY